MWNVFGQDAALTHLATAVKKGTLHHAYLFTGPDKSGKKLMAMDLARAVNCESENPPCGCCDSCNRITVLIHADVWLIDLENRGDEPDNRKQIKTEEIEDLQHSANLPPFEGKARVFIIDGAEALSSYAANRLLKILEEPPPRVIFILLSKALESVLPTIVSRCQHLAFRNVAYGELEAYLTERFGVDALKAKLVARLSGGRPGWAILALNDEKFLSDFLENRNKLLELYKASRTERFDYAEKIASQFAGNRLSVMDELKYWQVLARDVLFMQFGLEGNIINCDALEQLRVLAGRYKPSDVRNIIGAISQTREQLQRNINPRLALETMVLALECPERVPAKI